MEVGKGRVFAFKKLLERVPSFLPSCIQSGLQLSCGERRRGGAGRKDQLERPASGISGKPSGVTLGSLAFSLITYHTPSLGEVTSQPLPQDLFCH